MRGAGVRAVAVRSPWTLGYEILIGGSDYHGVRVGEDGRIVYEIAKETGDVCPTLLKLSREEFEALARAILEEERPEDATLEALKDARSVRDRLLSMFEARGIR